MAVSILQYLAKATSPKQHKILLLVLLFMLFAIPISQATANQSTELNISHSSVSTAQSTHKILHIEYQINPIFNAEEATGWIYKTANKLHINSQQKVVQRLLPFAVGDEVNQQAISEAERILRAQRFFRDARITVLKDNKAGGVILKVETWENWTLLPTVDIKREAGITEYAYGLEDDNLMGMGLLARLQYFSEQERDGYSFQLQSDVLTDFHLRSMLLAAKTTDGEQYQLLLNKPFYTLSDPWSARLNLEDSRLLETIYGNDEKVNRFAQDSKVMEFSLGYSEGLQSHNIWRYRIGLDYQRLNFELDPLTSFLPFDREKAVPWIGFEFLQNRYVKKTNLYLIGRLEDIRLGWFHRNKIGLNLADGDGKGAIHWSWLTRWTEQLNKRNFSNANLYIDAHESGADSKATRYYGLNYEHFYQASETRTWYAKFSYMGADNPYRDRPLTLGGETGLRGYPQAYLHADKHYLLNLEKRYYPGLNLFKLLDVGFVGFIDVGRAKGKSLYPNTEDKTLVSAGLGLRLFLSRSSGRTLINVNIAKPINSDLVDDIDFSVTLTSTL